MFFKLQKSTQKFGLLFKKPITTNYLFCFFKIAQNNQKIWAIFVRNFVAMNFQELTNLVTLPISQTS